MVENLFKQGGQGKSSFLPEEYVAAKSEARANILILSLFAVVLAGVIGAFMVTIQEKVTLERRIASVVEREKAAGARKEQLRELEKQRAQIMEKAEITAALFERVPRWTVLAEVTMRMPTAMRLDTLAIKSTRIEIKPPPPPPGQPKPTAAQAKSLAAKATAAKPAVPAEKPKVLPPRFEYALTISGAADQNNDIADFLTSLKESPALDKVEMTFIREARQDDKDLRLFELTATVRTNVDSNALAASLKDLVQKRTEILAAIEAAKEQDKNKGKALPTDTTTTTQQLSTASVLEPKENR